MKTCGSCRWRMNSRRSTDFGRCAVDDLLRAAAEYLEVGTSSFRDSLEEAIEAVRIAKEESGK